MSYEVEASASCLPGEHSSLLSPCSDPNPKHPSFKARHTEEIHWGRYFDVGGLLHKAFSSSLVFRAFCFIIPYHLPLLDLHPCHPRPSPFQTPIFFNPLPWVGWSLVVWQGTHSLLKALGFCPLYQQNPNQQPSFAKTFLIPILL